MNPTRLQNYKELFDYLVRLSDHLESKGSCWLAEEVRGATGFSMPTEFLHESHASLKKVLAHRGSALSGAQREEVASVVEQLETAFTR